MTHGSIVDSPTSFAAILFPGGPMVNSLLATSYISIIPNLLLYFVPPDIKSTTLSTLVHFAVGSLLGDVFLHLLPHAFSEPSHLSHHDRHLHGNEQQRNVIIGLGVFAGLFLFYATDKVMREWFEREGHHHHHHHDPSHPAPLPSLDKPRPKESKEHIVQQIAISDSGGKMETPHTTLQQRKPKSSNEKERAHVRASTYLNLLADFTHNLTDGIAMAASFYTSPAIGVTTAIAVFFHEIPHEISDYAILVQSGFSKKSAMMAQFTTAVGAYLGTFIGICLEEFITTTPTVGTKEHHDHHHHDHHHHASMLGIKGMSWNDLVIPLTAGGFLYIATVNVIPELLRKSNSKNVQEGSQLHLRELLAMVFGVVLMAVMAWNETHTH
ncbi:ZIP zinc transporter-domain-containing protein [Mycotypha africana]|uniref:ZIP zinc transporter-domain-containing protein n=1 Tax=Mycotypha africana TaxID=64632 RepID=UPI00230131BC|nr:ZIP zinc transporter-domain-containing protein [Mycotypha africana]KAI8977066.1 ZIP zinc transporter-domain-containing protein [Mycotypha africana]